MNTKGIYTIDRILPAQESVLKNDVFLVVLYANQIPPHLAVSINGKWFTLTTKGATVDGELSPMLRLINKNKIATIFIKLTLPVIFTMDELQNEIKRYTLAYPRVDVGIATCLAPIKDFCHEVYNTDTLNVNFIYDLLPELYKQNAISECYHLNLDNYLTNNSFAMRKYSMSDIYEGIRVSQLQIA